MGEHTNTDTMGGAVTMGAPMSGVTMGAPCTMIGGGHAQVATDLSHNTPHHHNATCHETMTLCH